MLLVRWYAIAANKTTVGLISGIALDTHDDPSPLSHLASDQKVALFDRFELGSGEVRTNEQPRANVALPRSWSGCRWRTRRGAR